MGGVDTESDPCWGVGSPSLMYCFTRLVSGVLVPYWTLYYGAGPVLLRTLKGFGLNAVLSLLVLSFLFLFLFFYFIATSIDIHCSIYI